MWKFLALALLVACATAEEEAVKPRCGATPTTASGRHAPGQICAGQLIFEDNFDFLDHTKWEHEVNSDGGGNYEFQAYVNSRENSFTSNGLLEIRPTLALPEDHPPQPWIPQPINSARMRTLNNFAFKYGRVVVRARVPVGDWLWPALWFLPERWVYGPWPLSGEIDLMESRGNRNLHLNGVQIGVEQVGTTLHFGPQWNINGWPTAHQVRNWAPGFHQEMHYYEMLWTPDRIEFIIDGVHHHTINVGTGFWDRGGFHNSGLPNPWTGGTLMAPFDQEFHMIINLAIGGTYFPDAAINYPGGKPWHNSSPNPMNDFWNGRSQWLPTWNRSTRDSHFMVDYVRVWAL